MPCYAWDSKPLTAFLHPKTFEHKGKCIHIELQRCKTFLGDSNNCL